MAEEEDEDGRPRAVVAGGSTSSRFAMQATRTCAKLGSKVPGGDDGLLGADKTRTALEIAVEGARPQWTVAGGASITAGSGRVRGDGEKVSFGE